jgi:hypothetical protein
MYLPRQWMELDWPSLLREHETKGDSNIPSTQDCDNILGRRGSHHIIANSKRKDIVKLTNHYQLGGYVKIGWPGIIIIEGLESSCQIFVEEIKSWRWQYLSVRADERISIPQGEDIDSYRLLPKEFVELGEDDMSTLAQYCRESDLDHLFLQCLKLSEGKSSAMTEAANSYAALVHVDHMNDRKGYQKWLQRECESAGCILFVRHCRSFKSSRPLIYVSVVGERGGVKNVLKRWRTSRVDVDSKSRPCLERMMSVLMEGELSTMSFDALERLETLSKNLPSEESSCLLEEMQDCIRCIFGDEWAESLVDP